MSDLDEFLGSNPDKEATPAAPPKEDNSGLGHGLTHALAVIGEGALHGLPNILGFGADLMQDAQSVIAPGTAVPVLPGRGPLSNAINRSFENAEQEYTKGATPKPQSNLEEFLNAAGQGLGSAMVGTPASAAGKAVLGGLAGGFAAEGTYKATGSDLAAYFAGLGAGGVPFLHGAGGHAPSAIDIGAQHPDFERLANQVVPELEGGGTLENPKTNSSSGAMGPMQVTPETARQPGYGIRPWDGKSQADLARVGREKLAVLLHKYDGDTSKALAAYNWGEGNLDKAIANHGEDWFYHAPAETQHYVLNGQMKLGTPGGSTGGPVASMAPEDIASAMGEAREPLGPAEPASMVEDNDPGEIVPIDDSLNSTIDSHLGEAHQVLQDYHEAGESDVSPEQAEAYRQGAEEILGKLNPDHPLYDKAQKAVDLWHEVQTKMDEDGIGAKEHLDELSPRGSDKFLGQEPKDVTPANNNTSAEDMFKMQDDAGLAPMGSADDMVFNEKTGNWEMPTNDNGKPPSGGDEPPFGGGGEGEGPTEPEGDKYAGSINLNRLAISNAAKENIRSMAKPMNVDIETHTETQAKAQKLIDDKGVEGVLNIDKVAPDDLAHYATAVRAIHAAAQEHMLKLNEEFLNPARNGDVAHVRWVHATEFLGKAFDRAQTVARGLGRGLGALRIEVGGTEGNLGEKLGDLMKSRASDEEIARMIQEHPDQAGKIARDAQKPGMNEVIFTTWYAMLLSSLKTLAKNVLSNSIMNIMDSAIIHPVAAGIGLLHGGEKVTFRASLAGMGGLAQGAIEGLKNAPEAYRRGTPSDFAERTQAYWKPQNKGIGRVISAPMRVLSAQDQVFLDAAQNAEYYRMAHIKAAAEGLSGEDYKSRVQDLLANPTKTMEKRAIKYAQMMRFQDPMEFKGLEYATRATKKDPVIIKVMKGFLRVLFPFPRNSDRMFFAAMRNSPLGVLEPQNLRDFRAGGAQRDVAMARVLVGTGAALGIYMWAANGGITGANPSDPSKKFMINLPGGVHISYQGLADPFSTTIGAIASAVEDAKTGGEDLYGKIFRSTKDLLGVLMSSTWATGASQFFQATDDNTGKSLQAWVGRMASSFTTPAIVREINQDYVDPTIRNTKDNPISDTIKAGIPGLSKTLPARHDQYGDVIKRSNPLYLDAINPARVQVDKHPDIDAALSTVNSPTPLLSKAPNHVTVDGVKHTLSAKGQERYQAVSGKIFQQLMESTKYEMQGLSNADKVKLIHKTMSEARKEARSQLWGATK